MRCCMTREPAMHHNIDLAAYPGVARKQKVTYPKEGQY